MEPNGRALFSAVQLEQPFKSPIYDGCQQFTAQANRFVSVLIFSAHLLQQ